MLTLTDDQLAALDAVARRWGVEALDLFGSGLDDRFRPASDVDLLVAFRPGVRRSLFDLVSMEEELGEVMDRPVDLVSRRGIERSANPIRRQSILGSARPLYRSPG